MLPSKNEKDVLCPGTRTTELFSESRSLYAEWRLIEVVPRTDLVKTKVLFPDSLESGSKEHKLPYKLYDYCNCKKMLAQDLLSPYSFFLNGQKNMT